MQFSEYQRLRFERRDNGVLLITMDRPEKYNAAEPPERWGRLLRGDAAELVPSVPGAWNLFYPAFAAAVRGTQPVPVDPWDAVATAALLDAARTSARTAQVVRPAPAGRNALPLRCW
ncbi:MAG TPA: Gfo/Idh/MocA family oxidoreductase [Streptosporangiaceae bacterium]